MPTTDSGRAEGPDGALRPETGAGVAGAVSNAISGGAPNAPCAAVSQAAGTAVDEAPAAPAGSRGEKNGVRDGAAGHPLRLEAWDEAEAGRWDAFVTAHADAGPYHRFAWLRAVRRAYGYRPLALAALRGDEVVGLLPGVVHRRPGRRTLISLPYCDYGGPLADDPAVAGRLVREACRLAAGSGAATSEYRLFQRDAVEDCPEKVVMRLALPDDFATLLASLKAKVRSQVNKPLRDGLTAGHGGPELLDAFHAVYARNMRDLGSPPHGGRWFREVLAAYGGAARIFVVRMPNGAPAAASVLLVSGATAAVPWASSLREFNRANPNMLLYRAMLEFAAGAGCAVFDFGRSTPGGGTFRFKRQWGARPYPLRWRRHGGDGEPLGDPADDFPGGRATGGAAEGQSPETTDEISGCAEASDRESGAPFASMHTAAAARDASGDGSPGAGAAGGGEAHPSRLRLLAAGCWRLLPVPVSTALGGALRKYISL